jgi:DNA-binding transcriptional LysR family regulator
MLDQASLLILVAVEDSTSLSQAAESLGITQSAVSQNLKTLENKLGFPVVSRQGKSVALTPAGLRLAKLARNYQKRFHDLLAEIDQEEHRLSGSIHIGTMIGIGKSWIASRMIEFSSHFQDVQLSVTMDFPDALIKGFESRKFDCLVLPERLCPHHSEHKLLHDERATLVFPDSPDFPLHEKMTMKEILEFPLIFFEERDPLFYQWCREKYQMIPRHTKPRLIVNAFGQVLQAVNEKLGIAVVPTHVFKRSFYRHSVKTLGKNNDIHTNAFHFVYHGEDRDKLKITTVFDFLQKEVANLSL